jgi:hypothetical protein
VSGPALAILGVVALAVSGACSAGAAEIITATYTFSWAGLDVGTFRARVEADAATYSARWEARTTGMVGTLFPFTSQGSARGRREGDRFAVAHYGGESSWRDGGSTWQVSFAADGRATAVDVPASERAEREPVPAELQVAPDPATLALTAIAAAQPGTRLDARSYDGRRVVAFAMSCAGAEPPATGELACAVSGELLAGGLRSWRATERERADREPIQVWLRRGVHGQGYWPVRLEVEAPVGTVTARLIGIERVPAAG